MMDVNHVANAVLQMAKLPLEANVQFMTILATKMPYIGRGNGSWREPGAHTWSPAHAECSRFPARSPKASRAGGRGGRRRCGC